MNASPAPAPVKSIRSPGWSETRRSTWVHIGYYLAVVLPITAYLWLGHSRFSNVQNETFWLGNTLAAFVPLAFPLIMALLSLIGMLAFGAPKDRRPGPDWHWNADVELIVAYVSRGHQPATLKRATSQTQTVLDELGVNYALEVVTDVAIDADNRLPNTGGDVFYYVVPSDYQTPGGARYKARALQYLLEQRTERLNGRADASQVWVLHLDEESILTQECVFGMGEHVEKYDLSRTPGAIGQGEILYNSYRYGDNALVTATDSFRTGNDLGVFRMSYKGFKRPLAGMHGSYVLTPARVEREITWDVGGHGSITEDAYFALLAMQRGVKFDWVEGYIREQSPFSMGDIVRQRRRWFSGLFQIALDPSLNFMTTLALRIQVFFWALGALALPLPLVYLHQKLLFGNNVLPYGLFMIGSGCLGLYAAACCTGTYRNLLHSELPLQKKAWIVFCTTISWIFNVPQLTECVGTLYGLFLPVSTFYVVAKDSQVKERRADK